MAGKKLWGIILVCASVAVFLYSLLGLYQIHQTQSMIGGLNGLYGGMAKDFTNKMLSAAGYDLESEFLKTKIIYYGAIIASAAGAYFGTKLVNAKA